MEAVPVQAGFESVPRAGTVPFDVSFADLSAPMPSEWHWSFGDGQQAVVQDPTHAYGTPGLYSVMLTSTRNGFQDIATKTGYITAYLDDTLCEPSNPVRVSNSQPAAWYGNTLQASYDAAAAEGNPLLPYRLDAYAIELVQELNLNAPLLVAFGREYDCDYATAYMGLTFSSLTISDGTAVFDSWPVTLKP
jgi:PKD repeat protein